MYIVVTKHARERIRQRFKLKVPVQQLADEAWDKGRIPSPGAMKFIFWKWVGSEHAMCDIRRYKGFFFFFRKDGNHTILITLYRDTGPKKKEKNPMKKLDIKDLTQSPARKFLKAVKLLK